MTRLQLLPRFADKTAWSEDAILLCTHYKGAILCAIQEYPGYNYIHVSRTKLLLISSSVQSFVADKGYSCTKTRLHTTPTFSRHTTYTVLHINSAGPLWFSSALLQVTADTKVTEKKTNTKIIFPSQDTHTSAQTHTYFRPEWPCD